VLNANSASATGSRATDEYRHKLCTAISAPMPGNTRCCRALSWIGTR